MEFFLVQGWGRYGLPLGFDFGWGKKKENNWQPISYLKCLFCLYRTLYTEQWGKIISHGTNSFKPLFSNLNKTL